MSRELISKEALQVHLESELHKFQECNRYRVTGITRLQSADTEGCNWSPLIATGSGGGTSRDPCVDVAERIVAEVRGKFNLA